MSATPPLEPLGRDAPLLRTTQGPVQAWDNGTGEPVLVVHGSPGGCDQGGLMAQFLREAGRRVIVPSRPGYLDTPLTPANASIDAQSDLHAALLDAVGVDRVDVVCWSGGGPSSYRFAVRHPERVRRLVAIAAVSRRYVWNMGLDERFMFGTRLGNWLLETMADRMPEKLVAATLQAEGDLSDAEVQKLAAAVYADPVERDFVLGLARTVSHRGDRRHGSHNDEQTFAAIEDLQLSMISAPVLLVQGTADTDLPPEYTDFAESQLREVTRVNVERGTHLAAFASANSAAVQGQMLEFLTD